MIGLARCAVAVLAFTVLVANAAHAQTARPAPKPSGPRFDVSAQAAWVGPVSFGGAAADLVRPDGSPLPLFTTDSRLGHGLSTEIHITLPKGRALAWELTGTWTRTSLQ